jgi:hypothetical protein
MNEVTAIAGDYRWFPFRLDASGTSVAFVHADRDDHRAVTFLDDELFRRSGDSRQVPVQELVPVAQALPANPCHFIFHSAFCCSTLLARALDVPGKSMGLKEPLVLNDLVQAAMAAGEPGVPNSSALAPILSLLARPFAAGETVIVKPSNAANPLIEQIMGARPASKALLLSSELPDFLRSVAKKALWGRIWARRSIVAVNRWPHFQPGFSEAERWEHSDLQVAALLWLDHRAQFSALAGQLGGRVASMDSTILLNDPSRALRAVGDFFELGFSPEEIAAIVGGPVFAKNSKRQDEDFNAQRRRDEHAAIGDALAEEIAMVAKWADSVADFAGIPKQLPQPLLS